MYDRIELLCVYKLVAIGFAAGILPWLWLSVIFSILSKIYGQASVVHPQNERYLKNPLLDFFYIAASYYWYPCLSTSEV